MSRTIRVLAVVILFVASGSAIALADEEGKGFSSRMNQARALYVAGDWQGARTQFLAAYELEPRPVLLYFVANTSHRLGDLRQALVYCERYLAEAPAEDAMRPRALGLAKRLRASLAQRDVGRPSLTAHPPARVAPDPRRPYQQLFWGGLATGVAALVATQLSAHKVRDLEDQKLVAIDRFQDDGSFLDPQNACADARSYDTTDARRIVSICDSGRRWAAITNGLLVGTVLTAGATAFFYYRGYAKPAPTRERARVLPSVSRSAVMVQLDFGF